MQPIERYGVIALLFLVIVVVVTVTWGGDPQPTTESGGFLAGEVRAADREARPSQDRSTRNKSTRPPLGRATASEASLASRLEQRPRSANPTPTRDRGTLAETLRSVSEGALASERENTRAPRTPQSDPYAPMTRTQLAAQKAREITTQPAPSPKSTSSTKTTTRPTTTARATQSSPRKIDATREVYEVQPGDTLSVIAQKTLGTATRWKEIADLNGGLDPRRMSVGMKLELPHGSTAPAPAAKKSTPAPSADKATPKAAGDYEIQNGDSLWKIAARELGDGERWKEIAALNPKLDPNRLIVGRAIALPEGRTSSPSSMQVASADRPRGRVR